MIKLWHSDVFIPQKLYHQVERQKTRFILNKKHKSYHLILDRLNNNKHDIKHDYTEKDVDDIVMKIMYSDIKPFEIETTDNKVSKYVIRISYDNERDISVVIRFNTIITAWINHKEDIHKTLDKSKYTTEEDWNKMQPKTVAK